MRSGRLIDSSSVACKRRRVFTIVYNLFCVISRSRRKCDAKNWGISKKVQKRGVILMIVTCHWALLTRSPTFRRFGGELSFDQILRRRRDIMVYPET